MVPTPGAVGNALTVISKAPPHPAGDIYVIVVLPGLIPVTWATGPELEGTVAIAGALLFHVPPIVRGLTFKVIADPWHRVDGPVI